ncbi:MAG: Gfo/Idh/MocA family oxidoreductase [Bifidobacteriaceae bacterium]|nr:Gfo/Idh/MocA family oxidoreductase [Bifidobacteriaceae bacterium]
MNLIPDPFTAPPLNWGILGTGTIAHAVADAMANGTRQRLAAVGSRSPARANEFAAQFGAERAHGSPEDLMADDGVDIVYIATPNSAHHAGARAALLAGKHVLVEKPFTLNQPEARDLADLAAERKAFLMEAMWTRFLPQQIKLRQLIADGALGELVTAWADFGSFNPMDAEGRFYSPNLGGGSLLDLGIYPVSWIVNLFGLPGSIRASGLLTQTGVDAQMTAILEYPAREASAVAMSSIVVDTPWEAVVAGTRGLVKVPRPFWGPSSLIIELADGTIEEWTAAVRSTGYEYELAEVATRIAAGETFSPEMAPAESVAIMGVLDAIRAQIGVRFPGDNTHA